jgi:hypothetical protein
MDVQYKLLNNKCHTVILAVFTLVYSRTDGYFQAPGLFHPEHNCYRFISENSVFDNYLGFNKAVPGIMLTQISS